MEYWLLMRNMDLLNRLRVWIAHSRQLVSNKNKSSYDTTINGAMSSQEKLMVPL